VESGERFDKQTPETEEMEPGQHFHERMLRRRTGERFDKQTPRGRVRQRNGVRKRQTDV